MKTADTTKEITLQNSKDVYRDGTKRKCRNRKACMSYGELFAACGFDST